MITPRKFSIGIIDTSNVKYSHSSVETELLPPAQTAIINMAESLFEFDFFVTVLNSGQRPRLHNYVNYQPIESLKQRDYQFDIVISVDSLVPFDPGGDSIYQQIQRSDQLKILWSHSSEIAAGENLEKFVVNRYIDQIFTVSDRHTNELINGLTGTRRMYETLKRRVFQTRYGVREGYKSDPVLYAYPGNYKNKKQESFSFNYNDVPAAEFLLTKIWPRIKAHNPLAELFMSVDLDNSSMRALFDQHNNQNSVIFKNEKSFNSRLSFNETIAVSLYPSVSWSNQIPYLLENISVNVPVIGFRSSSFFETIGEHASYIIDNHSDWTEEQLVEQFVKKTVDCVANRYLHQQVMYSCNLTKEILSWKSVALQWKQQICHTFGSQLEDKQKTECQWINHRTNAILSKTWVNTAETLSLSPVTQSTPVKYGNLTVAFVDLSGASYDGSTLSKRGLGGSESAVISIARELAKIGFQITVFNACDEDDCRPGVYDGVEYLPLNLICAQSMVYDVVVSLRTPEIFANEEQFNYNFGNARRLPLEHYDLLKKARLRVMWMHDTFSRGDNLVEKMLLNGQFDEVWTLSDFHRNYFLNCNHGQPRNYALLKNRVWTTRNGINKYIDSVNLTQKDPDLFVYNANLSKGLKPLLRDIWPRVREKIPSAKLVVIGGYYELGAVFNSHRAKDEFENVVDPYRNDSLITFTGIITQSAVADIVHKASFFIYPCDFPETFSISAWESLSLGTPLITCRFGALEETAIEQYSYLIDYPVTANTLFPDIDEQQQIEKFVDLTVAAHQNKEQLIQKQQVYQEIADIATWETVAFEWKQHIYQCHQKYLSDSENQRVQYSLNKYRRLTGRTSLDIKSNLLPKLSNENRIVVISPFRNANTHECILSLAAQRYSNYHQYIIDDCSDDDSAFMTQLVIQNLPEEIQNKITFIRREKSLGAVHNQVDIIRGLNNNDIVVLLDGDDYLANRADIFDFYNYLYSMGTEFTYGSIWSEADNIPLVAQTYSDYIKHNRSYREERFNWYIPYTHLRTFRKYLINNVPDSDFQDNKNQWFRAGGDVAVFYNLIEQADPARIRPVHDVVYHYNDNLQNNDFRQNQEEQYRNSQMIVLNEHRNKIQKRILIAVPTARYIEPATFKAIYDQKISKDYEVNFQYFYGYNVDQVRNLIASWAVNGYDYLWAVDSDISFASDTLQRLIDHDRDVVSAVYRQRIPGQTVVELYRNNDRGGVTNINWNEIKGQGLVEIQACGFGCVLIKSEVLKSIGYPQFQYHSALDHNDTVSEDVDFCRKATNKGFRIWADTNILCDHHGSIVFGMNQ
jgi:glycosyltransferase involved in cell wall biosynthesis